MRSIFPELLQSLTCRIYLLLWLLIGLTSHVTAVTTLQLVWIAPGTEHSDSSFPFNASSSVAALALGLQTINDESILPDYQFNVTWLDSNCSSKETLGQLVDTLVKTSVDLVIGPPCSNVVETVGELLAYRDIPLINWMSIGQTITSTSKTDLTTYIRTMAPISSLGGIMLLFYLYTGWRRMVIVSSKGEDYIATAATIENSLVSQSERGFHVVHHYREVSTNATDTEIDQILFSIIYEGRVIILVIPREELRKYMLHAHALGMTSGDYQFLYSSPDLLGDNDVATITSDVLWKQGDVNDDVARQAFENVLFFVLGHSPVNQKEWASEALAAVSTWFSGRNDMPEPTTPDEYSVYLHDSLVLYARAANLSLTLGGTTSGKSIFTWTPFIAFKGLSGDVVMNFLCDRQPFFFVYDLSSAGVFEQVASLQYVINGSDVTVESTFTRIIWGDGQTSDDFIPADSPDCGFFNENCPTTSSTDNSSITIIIAVVTSTMLVVLLVLFLVFRWWRWEKGLKSTSWKIPLKDLDFAVSKRTSSVLNISGRFAQSTVSLGSDKSGRMTVGTASTGGMSAGRRQIFTTIALYKGEIVAVKKVKKTKVNVDRSLLLEMKQMTELKHSNLTPLAGVCTATDNICSVWEYCNKGSVQDVIQNDDIRLDSMFKLSLAMDMCQGLAYLHKSPLKVHGNLKSSNCVIDSRWVCKLTDFGLEKFKAGHDRSSDVMGEHAYYASLFWTAPELLKKVLKKEPVTKTTAGDIYAVGIIIKELLCRNEPYCAESKMSPKEIILKVAHPVSEQAVLRPAMSDLELDSEYHSLNMEYLIQRCWSQDVDLRPSIKAVIRTINKVNPFKKSSVVDNMIAMMEKYTNNLEEIVAERTEQLQEEKRKTDNLLYRMLPRKVTEDLKSGRSVKAEAFESVTIYFSDIVEFTTLAGESTPMEIVAFLNALYTLFDDIISNYDVYKVETIGDAYMIVSGLPERNSNLHVREISRVALHILQETISFKIPHKPDRRLQIRIGLHTGPVVAGVVGLTMPRYCLFGDTVNTASRMESNGKALRVHISKSTRDGLLSFPEFQTEDRGEIPIKGKGMMRTYWLLSRDTEGQDTPQADDNILAKIHDGETDNLASEEKVSDNSETPADDDVLCRKDGQRAHFQDGDVFTNCTYSQGSCICADETKEGIIKSDEELTEDGSCSRRSGSDSPDFGYEGDRDSMEGEILFHKVDKGHPRSISKLQSDEAMKSSNTPDIEDFESGIKSGEDATSVQGQTFREAHAAKSAVEGQGHNDAHYAHQEDFSEQGGSEHFQNGGTQTASTEEHQTELTLSENV